ncbi:MAG: TlpA disulfide reductase family protein [Daejeonella sp.]
MKQSIFIYFFLALTACHSSDSKNAINPKLSTPVKEKIDVEPENILKDFKTWYEYHYYNIKLAQDFLPKNENSQKISKSEFLKELNTGKFAAFKTEIVDNVPSYQLYRIKKVDESMSAVIRQLAQIETDHFNLEGKEIVNYHFTDLNGKKYSRSSAKGKIVLLKCWFIACKACVEEFPELNMLVEKYKDHKDIEFISLASDKALSLDKFLKKKEFKYEVVPEVGAFMTKDLNVTAYPTHFLINRNGHIVKVSNNIHDILPFLEREISKEL